MRRRGGVVFVAAALAIAALAFLGVLTYRRARAELFAAAEQKYATLRDVRAAALADYLNGLVQETRYWAGNRVVHAALASFRAAWDRLGDDPAAEVHRLLAEGALSHAGRGEELTFAGEGASYAEVHASYHGWFEPFLVRRGYYDVFLIDPQGNVVYTVFKERDLATNLETGPLRESGLARAFREARDHLDDAFVAVTDFEAYSPSGGVPAAFLASPVLDGAGALRGVLAFQVSHKRIDEIMQVEAGMGATGETYVVGGDLLMRSDSRFSERSTVLQTTVDTETARRALAGESGIQMTDDYRGVRVLSAYAPLDFHGLRWALLAEIDEAEVMKPVAELRVAVARAGMGVVFACVIGLLVATLVVPVPEGSELP
jgi:methyl-accepting chemotaxis protein